MNGGQHRNNRTGKNFVMTPKLVRHESEVNDTARSNATRLMVWLLCASLIAVGAATSYVGWSYLNESPRFRLTHVEISGNERASHEEIVRHLALGTEDNIFALDLDVARESLSRHPWIAEVEIRRVIPDTLVVRVREHVPVAIVALSKLYYLNEAREPFSRVVWEEAPELPLLTGLDAALYEMDRARWNALVDLGLELSAAAKRAALPTAEIQLDPSSGVIAHLLPAGTTAHMGQGDFDAKIRRLKDVRALLVERGQHADTFLLDNPRHPDAVVARLNAQPLEKSGAFVGVR